MDEFTESSFNALQDAARNSGMTERKLAESLHRERDARRQLMLLEFAKTVQNVQQMEVHALQRAGGLRPVMEIPLMAYVAWASKFKQQALEAGVRDFSGWDCWAQDSEFFKWWKKKNPELAYREAKHCAQTSIIVPETRWSRLPQKSERGTRNAEVTEGSMKGVAA